MPCYLFTYHAYGSWLPDRSRGYVKRGQGILPRDAHMHRLYVESMTESHVKFPDEHQRHAIESMLESHLPQRFELYYVATDATHIHALVAWRDQREPARLRALLKGSLSRSLNARIARRTWLAEGGSRKQVRDRAHFDYLVGIYLPKHSGWKWSREKEFYK